MQRVWQIQEAKNKLSEVVEGALEEGPQILTRRGVEVAVVLSFSEYQEMKKKQPSLLEFFQRSPLAELDLERDRSLGLTASRGSVPIRASRATKP